jgi:hypothetical protein
LKVLFKFPFLLLSLTLPLFAGQAFGEGTINTPALSAEQLPGMTLLIKTVQAMPIDNDEKAEMLAAVQPSAKRPYYRMDESFLDPAQRAALIKEYATLLNIPESQVTLFAVTSPPVHRTVLFPEFFNLKSETAQAALLFHESLWAMGAKDYGRVVQAEGAMQNYLDHPDDPDAYFNFYHTLWQFYYWSGPENLMNRAFVHVLLPPSLQYDRTHGSNSTSIPLEKVFGSDFLTGWLTDPQFANQDSWNIKLRTYYLTCSDDECPQSSLFVRAMKIYVTENQGRVNLVRSEAAPSTITPDLVLDLNPRIDLHPPVDAKSYIHDREISFSIEKDSQPVGTFFIYYEAVGAD